MAFFAVVQALLGWHGRSCGLTCSAVLVSFELGLIADKNRVCSGGCLPGSAALAFETVLVMLIVVVLMDMVVGLLLLLGGTEDLKHLVIERKWTLNPCSCAEDP
jgi:hypothetical protein